MKNIKHILKQDYKKILGIIFLVIVIGGACLGNINNVYGAVNSKYETDGEAGTIDVDKAVSDSTILDGVARFLYAIAGFIEKMVSGIIGSITGSNMFPWADRVVFNSIPFLDVNFINPANGSMFRNGASDDTTLGKIVINIYYTIFLIATSFLGVVVGIMALKLAISSIAAEKAKYKQAIQNWVFAIILIFTSHYLMSFIFWINEKMVEAASAVLIAQGNSIEIDTSSSSGIDADKVSTKILENVFKWHFNSEIKPLGGTKNADAVPDNVVFYNPSGKDMTGTIYCIAIGDEGGNSYHAVQYYKSMETRKSHYSSKESFLNSSTFYEAEDRGDDDIRKQWNNNMMLLLSSSRYVTGGSSTDGEITVDQEGDVWSIMLDSIYLTLIQNVYPEVIREKQETNFINGLRNFISTVGVDYDISNKFGKGDKETHYKEFWNTIADEGDDSASKEVFTGMAEFFRKNVFALNFEESKSGSAVTNFNAIPAILYSIFVIQSIMYFIAYLRRFFYIVVLALFAPLVVIYDFLSKTVST